MRNKIIVMSILSVISLSACNNASPVNLSLPVLNQEQIDIEARAYNIIEIRGIGEVYQKKLNTVGITNTNHLLKRSARRTDRSNLAKQTGISEKLILEWANHADLMRINGIGPKIANFLEDAAGVDSIPELAQRNPNNLFETLNSNINIDNRRKYLNKSLSLKQVIDWVEVAGKTEPKVILSY